MSADDRLDAQLRRMLQAIEGPEWPSLGERVSRRPAKLRRRVLLVAAAALVAVAAILGVVLTRGATGSEPRGESPQSLGGGCALVEYQGTLYEGRGVLAGYGLRLADELAAGSLSTECLEGDASAPPPVPLQRLEATSAPAQVDPAVAVGSPDFEGILVVGGRCAGPRFSGSEATECLLSSLLFGGARYTATSVESPAPLGRALGTAMRQGPTPAEVAVAEIQGVPPERAVADATDPTVVYVAPGVCVMPSDTNAFVDGFVECLVGGPR
jgi:hypothetical protein